MNLCTSAMPVGRALNTQFATWNNSGVYDEEIVPPTGVNDAGTCVSPLLYINCTSQDEDETGWLEQLLLIEENSGSVFQEIGLRLFLARATFTVSKGSAFAYDGDIEDIIGWADVGDGGYVAFSTTVKAAISKDIKLNYQNESTRMIYAVLVNIDGCEYDANSKLYLRVYNSKD